MYCILKSISQKPIAIKFILPVLLFISVMVLPAMAKVGNRIHYYPITDTISTQLDKQPEYPGGLDAFYKFIGQIVRYPMVDMEARVQGTVIVTFIVEPDGLLSNIKAVRGPSETLKREALRVVANSPKWNPGIKDDKPVRAAYTVPVKFVMTKTLY